MATVGPISNIIFINEEHTLRSERTRLEVNSKSEKIRAESAFVKHVVNSHGGKSDDKNCSDYLEILTETFHDALEEHLGRCSINRIES